MNTRETLNLKAGGHRTGRYTLPVGAELGAIADILNRALSTESIILFTRRKDTRDILDRTP